MSDIRFSKEEDAGYITIDRPEVKNAISNEAKKKIIDKLWEYDKDDETACVVFRSTSDVFISGGDIKEMQDEGFSVDALKETWDAWNELWETMHDINIPTISQVDGQAFAGGFILLSETDIVIASENAVMGQPVIDFGFVDFWGSLSLPDYVGPQQTFYYLLTGAEIPARKAVEMGLVSKAVPPDKLEQEIKRLVDDLSNKNPKLVKFVKEAINTGRRTDQQTNLRKLQLEFFESQRSMGRPTFQEGIEAFLEDREPNWD